MLKVVQGGAGQGEGDGSPRLKHTCAFTCVLVCSDVLGSTLDRQTPTLLLLPFLSAAVAAAALAFI